MPVDQQLGPVGEVGGELDEERAEVLIHAVHVKLVDHRGCPHDPRVGPAVGGAAFLGPEHGVLLLRPADEQDSLGPAGCLERGQVLVHHIVFALPPGEVDPRDAAIIGEAPQPGHEVPAHRRDHRGRGDRLAQVTADEPDDALRPLELRDIQVAVFSATDAYACRTCSVFTARLYGLSDRAGEGRVPAPKARRRLAMPHRGSERTVQRALSAAM
jgi:hypothetical protein